VLRRLDRRHEPRGNSCRAIAITVERLLPAGERVARITGVVMVGIGLSLIATRI